MPGKVLFCQSMKNHVCGCITSLRLFTDLHSRCQKLRAILYLWRLRNFRQREHVFHFGASLPRPFKAPSSAPSLAPFQQYSCKSMHNYSCMYIHFLYIILYTSCAHTYAYLYIIYIYMYKKNYIHPLFLSKIIQLEYSYFSYAGAGLKLCFHR